MPNDERLINNCNVNTAPENSPVSPTTGIEHKAFMWQEFRKLFKKKCLCNSAVMFL